MSFQPLPFVQPTQDMVCLIHPCTAFNPSQTYHVSSNPTLRTAHSRHGMSYPPLHCVQILADIPCLINPTLRTAHSRHGMSYPPLHCVQILTDIPCLINPTLRTAHSRHGMSYPPLHCVQILTDIPCLINPALRSSPHRHTMCDQIKKPANQ